MTEPDPKTVREIARKHIRSGRTDIGTTVALHFGRGVLSYEEFAAWEYDVHKAWRVELRAVSWPDEQQPADVVTAEQQQDGAVGRVEAFLTAWRYYGNDGLVSSECQPGETRKYAELTEADLRAVLAERTALAARVAELESERASLAVLLLAEPDEREADTRAVLAVLKLGEVLYLGQRPTDWADARRQLNARFADRIEALDATETEES